MNIIDLLNPSSYVREEYKQINQVCSIFVEESKGLPLLKNLSTKYLDIQKVKVRKKNSSNTFVNTFNEAFEEELDNLHQRAVFANGLDSFEPADPISEGLEPFYIFPINGYRFMYSSEVENSNQDYKKVFDSMFEQFGDERGKDVVTDLLKFTYCHENLYEGIEKGSEIIIYNIPYFYAIRATSDNYTELLTTITS